MIEDGSQLFLPYFLEARRRLLYYLASWLLIFIGLLPFSATLYQRFILPLVKQLPHGSQVIATTMISPVWVPIKLVALMSVFLSVPIFLYHAWMFIAPALYRRERYQIRPILIGSCSLFYLGMLFAYGVVIPWLQGFLIRATPTGVALMPDIGLYLDFTLQLGLAFGFAFQVPLIMVVVTMLARVSYAKWVALRPYFIVAAFVIGMIFSPPDVISQICLAIPMWLLFESGLLAVRWLRICQP